MVVRTAAWKVASKVENSVETTGDQMVAPKVVQTVQQMVD